MKHKIICSFLTLFLSSLVCTTYGQKEKSLTIGLSTGRLNSPYFDKAKSRHFYALDFDYQLSKRSILSANYTAGEHDYLDTLYAKANSYLVNNKTNSTATYRIFSILYKYQLIDKGKLNANLGTGLSMMTMTRRYPYETPTSLYFAESTWTDLAFPISTEINYLIAKDIRFGLIGAFYVHPDYPTLAWHFGPKISYSID